MLCRTADSVSECVCVIHGISERMQEYPFTLHLQDKLGLVAIVTPKSLTTITFTSGELSLAYTTLADATLK
jgi:hypothetical protein